MDNIFDGDDDSAPVNRPAARLIGLSDELTEWADQNQELITRIQRALADSYAHLKEDQLWEVIAAAVEDPQWLKARQNLHEAKETWSDMNSPLNVPLGAIGQALDSDERDAAKENYLLSLSDFTIINEGLRKRPDLSMLLNVLMAQRRMLDQSEGQTQQTKASTEALAELSPLREYFKRAAKRPSRIQKQFRAYTQRLLSARKPAPITSVIVPWLPGI